MPVTNYEIGRGLALKQRKGDKPKMRKNKLIICVYRQRALKQKGVKQVGRKTSFMYTGGGGTQIFPEFESSAQTRHSSGFCHQVQ